MIINLQFITYDYLDTTDLLTREGSIDHVASEVHF